MDFIEIYELLNLLSPLILIIGLICGFYFYKSLDIIHKSITIYFLVMLLVDITGRIFEYRYGNNLIILLVYSLIELIMFIYFYYQFMFKAKHRLIIISSLLAIGYIVWEIFKFKSDAKEFQTYSKIADNFIIVLLTLTFFFEKINIFKESKWSNFKLNAVILAFFSINMLFFLPYNFIINATIGFWFWLGILVSTTLFYSYLTHCIWKNGRTHKLLPSGSR